MADVDGDLRATSFSSGGGGAMGGDESQLVLPGALLSLPGINRGLPGTVIIPPPVPDTTPPVVSNYDPAQNTAISSTTAIEFDVTDETGQFCSIMVTAFFANTGAWEVIHTGSAFSPTYLAGSGRSVITNGFHYIVRRTGGWSLSPTIITFAVDAGGNEST